MRKSLAILLVLALALVPIVGMVGCAGGASSGGGTTASTGGGDVVLGSVALPIADPPITVTYGINMHVNDSYDPALPKPQELMKRTGINVSVIAFQGDTANEQRNVIIASGDLPDMIMMSPANANLYGYEDKIIQAVDQYLDIMPNYTATFTEDDLIPMRNDIDGQLYGLPRTYGLNGTVEYSQDYQYNLLEDNGWTEPEDLDQWYDLMIAARDKYVPTNELFIPLIMSYTWSFGDTDGIKLISAFDICYIYDRCGMTYNTRNDKTMTYIPTSEEYKYFLEYFQRLYKEKLIAQNYMNATYEEWWDKGMCVGNGITAVGPNHSRCYNATMAAKDAGIELYWEPGTYLKNRSGVRSVMRSCVPFDQGQVYCLSADTDYAEQTVRLCDYLYTMDGSYFWNNGGFEGVDWELDEDGISVWPLDAEGNRIPLDDGTARTEASNVAAAKGGWFNFFADKSKNHIPTKSSNDQTWANFNRNVPLLEKMPVLVATTDLLTELTQITADLNTQREVARDEFVTGKRQISEWDSYVKELEALNCNRVLEITQQWLDNYYAAMK